MQISKENSCGCNARTVSHLDAQNVHFRLLRREDWTWGREAKENIFHYLKLESPGRRASLHSVQYLDALDLLEWRWATPVQRVTMCSEQKNT